MSNCLKCNHCGVIGVEALNEPGPEDNWRAFIGVKGWAYIGKIRKTGSYYPSDEFWDLCPTCTGYLEVFMGERKPGLFTRDHRYAYEAPATPEGSNAE